MQESQSLILNTTLNSSILVSSSILGAAERTRPFQHAIAEGLRIPNHYIISFRDSLFPLSFLLFTIACYRDGSHQSYNLLYAPFTQPRLSACLLANDLPPLLPRQLPLLPQNPHPLRNPNSPRHLQHRSKNLRKWNRKEKRVIYLVKEFGKIGLHREIRWKQPKNSSLKRELSSNYLMP